MLFNVSKKVKWLGVLALFMPTFVFSETNTKEANTRITPGYNALFSLNSSMVGEGGYLDVAFGVSPHLSVVTLFDTFYSSDDSSVNTTYLRASIGFRIFLVPQYFFFDILGTADLTVDSKEITTIYPDGSSETKSRLGGGAGGTVAVGALLPFTEKVGLQLSGYFGIRSPFSKEMFSNGSYSLYYGLRAGLSIKI